MVRLEELEALDLLVWLESGTAAATLAGTNQSTICRRAQRVLATFKAQLLRDRAGWHVRSPIASLLDLQRQIHQLVRLQSQAGLRLNVPFWSRSVLPCSALEGWLINPQQGPLLCQQPLELLRAHVIDACLLTPTQLADQETSDLVLFDLYSSRIGLHLLGAAAEIRPDPSPEAAFELLLRSRLELLPFLPATCLAASQRRFEQLRCAADPSATAAVVVDRAGDPACSSPRVAFLTPQMAMALNALRPLSLQLDWPYRESLAVLRCNAEQPALQSLVERLRSALALAIGARERLVCGRRPGGCAGRPLPALTAAPGHRLPGRGRR